LKLSISLFTHPLRKSRLEETLKLLGEETSSMQVIEDKRSEGILETSLRAWSSYDPSADYHMVLQDDIIPCHNFLASIPSILAYLPLGSTASLCDNFPVMSQSHTHDKHWLVTDLVHNACALIQPVKQIDDFVQWASWNIRHEYFHDDGALETYLKLNKLHCWHTIPSLIRHNNLGSVYSMRTGIKDRRRIGPTESVFIGANADPLDLDWEVRDDNIIDGRKHHSKLSDPQLWAIGQLDEPMNDMVRSGLLATNSAIWNEETLSIPYDIAIATSRIRRGLSI